MGRGGGVCVFMWGKEWGDTHVHVYSTASLS